MEGVGAMSLRYVRHKPSFKHEEITEPGLYDIREYDADEVEISEEDGIPFEDVKPIREYQLWVSETFTMDDKPLGEIVCSEYKNGIEDGFIFRATTLWESDWITQRLIARLAR